MLPSCAQQPRCQRYCAVSNERLAGTAHKQIVRGVWKCRKYLLAVLIATLG